MRLRRSDSGSTLIMVMGIIAALAIMSATLVILVANAQSGTADDRTRVKAFNVAEAALDEGMYQLSATWPESQATSFDEAEFIQRFDPTEFPGVAVTVDYYDDDGARGMNSGSHIDHPVNNLMWVVAQAGTGSKLVRLQAMVEREVFDTAIPHGNAIYSGGPMVHDDLPNPPALVDPSAPYAGSVYVLINGTPAPNAEPAGPGVQPALYPPKAGSLESVFPEATKQGLKTLAQSHGRYFTGANAIQLAEDSPTDPTWSPEGGISGLTVIEPTVPGTLTLTQVSVNSQARPGIVLLLKCPVPSTSVSNLDFAGSKNDPGYYGVLYTDGTVVKGSGGYNVHGMVVAAGNTEFQGTVNVMYNDEVLSNLGQMWASNVSIVGNTWRELSPVTSP